VRRARQFYRILDLCGKTHPCCVHGSSIPTSVDLQLSNSLHYILRVRHPKPISPTSSSTHPLLFLHRQLLILLLHRRHILLLLDRKLLLASIHGHRLHGHLMGIQRIVLGLRRILLRVRLWLLGVLLRLLVGLRVHGVRLQFILRGAVAPDVDGQDGQGCDEEEPVGGGVNQRF